MIELSIGAGILAAVVFLVLMGLTAFTIILWKDVVDGTGVFFSTTAFTSLTLVTGYFLAYIIGLV